MARHLYETLVPMSWVARAQSPAWHGFIGLVGHRVPFAHRPSRPVRSPVDDPGPRSCWDRESAVAGSGVALGRKGVGGRSYMNRFGTMAAAAVVAVGAGVMSVAPAARAATAPLSVGLDTVLAGGAN